MKNEQAIEAALVRHKEAIQEMADLMDEHIEVALGMLGIVAYKLYHPKSCPSIAHTDEKKEPPETDIPDAFKRMFDGGETVEEPKAD